MILMKTYSLKEMNVIVTKIKCVENYCHNTWLHYTKGKEYVLHKINWENKSVKLSSNYHLVISTELDIIKKHFDLTNILRKRKIDKLLNK